MFPVEVRDGEVWVDLSPQEDRPAYLRQRLREGLERNISLVVAKSAIGLLSTGKTPQSLSAPGWGLAPATDEQGWGSRADHTRVHDEPLASLEDRGPFARPLPRPFGCLA